ncbi:unnamed protein product [Menidia menidia]|uniref:(Atlantic silverside) hypothetical protein n=1 Tax=Menidia menidia TaxID=238744 RepID=A0A8S4AT42_9TELE|nr:unnamed protein product [Menidia menidia]
MRAALEGFAPEAHVKAVNYRSSRFVSARDEAVSHNPPERRCPGGPGWRGGAHAGRALKRNQKLNKRGPEGGGELKGALVMMEAAVSAPVAAENHPSLLSRPLRVGRPILPVSVCVPTSATHPPLTSSPVVSVGFARFHPNLVVGGTYSGQIVLWDNRSHRRTPVQRTPLSAAAHTHPVYCVNVVGTQNANNLITVSTDGRMCSWSLDMLSQPQETMELAYNKSKPVAVTGMAFPTGDVNNYVVGSEEGTVYTASRHGSKAGICEMFEGHQGPVTGISCHSAVGTVDFSHLFITSSFDWTIKLWSTKMDVIEARCHYDTERPLESTDKFPVPAFHLLMSSIMSSEPYTVLWRCVNVRGFLIRPCTQTGPKAEAAPLCLKPARSLSPFLLAASLLRLSPHNKPLYSFEDNADYVYDVMWSPVHPALFAAVDGMGRLDLWNLNNDTEVRAVHSARLAFRISPQRCVSGDLRTPPPRPIFLPHCVPSEERADVLETASPSPQSTVP